MPSQSTIRSIAAVFLAAVLVGTLSSRPAMATSTPTRWPTASLGYWYKDTFNGQTVGLTKTVSPGGNSYDGSQFSGGITGAIVVINGQKTHIQLNRLGDDYCYAGSGPWEACQQYIGVYDCLYFANTGFYTRATCSPTGPLAGFPRPSPPPAAPPPPCCHLPRSLSSSSPVRLRRRGPDQDSDAGADGSTHPAAHS